jgi:hypothetical protein
MHLAGTMVESIWLKLREQIERTEHLIKLIPADCTKWSPPVPIGATDLGHLLGHLLDCLAGFCAAFHAAFPAELAHFAKLRCLPVNHSCEPATALSRIGEYTRHLEEAFDLCTDEHLSRRVPSLLAPEGEPLSMLLLGNLEHLINHKYQLFFYLRLLGLPVTSRDIYRWREGWASPHQQK